MKSGPKALAYTVFLLILINVVISSCAPLDVTKSNAPTIKYGKVIVKELPGVKFHSYRAKGKVCHIIETNKSLILQDTVQDWLLNSELKHYLNTLGKPLDRIIISHGHVHHWAGLEMFPGAIYEATERMHWSAAFVIAERILFVVVAVTFLYLGFGLKSLLIISIVSHSVTVFTSFIWSRRLITFKMLSKVQIAPAMLRPTLIFSLLTFLGYLTIRVDLLMISLLGTTDEVGLYAVAAKIAQQGIMLRNVTATAFFPIAVKAFHKHAVNGTRLLRYSAMFFAVMFTGSVVVSLLARDLVPLILGGEYAGSGEILAVLVFFVGVSWIRLPFTTALQATHNEKYSFWPMLLTALLNAPLNYVLYRRFGVIGIAYSTIIVASVGSLAFCVLGSVVLTKQGHLTLNPGRKKKT